MKRISIIFMVLLMAGCGNMGMHRGSSGSPGAPGASGSGTQDDLYRGGARFNKSPGERLTDPYDPWFSG